MCGGETCVGRNVPVIYERRNVWRAKCENTIQIRLADTFGCFFLDLFNNRPPFDIYLRIATPINKSSKLALSFLLRIITLLHSDWSKMRYFNLLNNCPPFLKKVYSLFLQCWFKLTGQTELIFKFETRFSQIGLSLGKNLWRQNLLKILARWIWCNLFYVKTSIVGIFIVKTTFCGYRTKINYFIQNFGDYTLLKFVGLRKGLTLI